MNTSVTVTPQTFLLGGQTPINRLAYGAMRITGPGIWGPPDDSFEALMTLRELPTLGINFIDTPDSYGPNVSEWLIAEALRPYDNVIVATKAGFVRPGPGVWEMDGRPEHLHQRVERSLENLGLDQLALWQLHRIDPKIPRDEQFDAIRIMQADGLINHVGLSEVSVDDIKAASTYFDVATVQNRYNLVDRHSEDVLRYCESQHIGFIPWYPLGAGSLARADKVLQSIARTHHATPAQIALAWLLGRSPVVIAIPGTSNRRHLAENAASVHIRLTETEHARLDALA
ncbi:aldo/keto reductase [Paraburkholderia caribensis]|uniref:aldo/keto reductase n=1 Tax=Paraburkholderia caribensis TaxID=75105 RepID=UPI001CB393F9|nr:aldo/keto reductase [Paraburkholderia caribensis]CAG9262482.1 Predicted oxidoreductase [Paraburkholderia caribensis]